MKPSKKTLTWLEAAGKHTQAAELFERTALKWYGLGEVTAAESCWSAAEANRKAARSCLKCVPRKHRPKT